MIESVRGRHGPNDRAKVSEYFPLRQQAPEPRAVLGSRSEDRHRKRLRGRSQQTSSYLRGRVHLLTSFKRCLSFHRERFKRVACQ